MSLEASGGDGDDGEAAGGHKDLTSEGQARPSVMLARDAGLAQLILCRDVPKQRRHDTFIAMTNIAIRIADIKSHAAFCSKLTRN